MTFLAPADRCNQQCPRCVLTEVLAEPVNVFGLTPEDYALCVRQFLSARVPVLGINFQGYEVTLPRSWPYLEAAFAEVRRLDVRKGFITNGMLLHKWTDRIIALDIQRISVSLDGACPEINDPIRGLPGAFDAAVGSVREFLKAAPQFRDRLGVASCLYTDENVRSLLKMPRLLGKLGIPRWALSFGVELVRGRAQPIKEEAVLQGWLRQLTEAGAAEGIRVHVNDELGVLKTAERSGVQVRQLFDPRFLYRIDPLGHVRAGHEVIERWDAKSTRRWDPASANVVDVCGYWDRPLTADC